MINFMKFFDILKSILVVNYYDYQLKNVFIIVFFCFYFFYNLKFHIFAQFLWHFVKLSHSNVSSFAKLWIN